MTLQAFFPTYIYSAVLHRADTQAFNRQLVAEATQLRKDDRAGRAWSAKNYPGGYTSYGSAHHLHRMSPTFQTLERRLRRHIKAFSNTTQWDLSEKKLEMTDCWVNIMGRQVVHGLHLHPLSTVSGTYYVQVPARSPGIKFEDPRLDRMMAAPARRADADAANRPWITLPAIPGELVLFESWLRHEVMPNPAAAERISVSFNYNWF
jgi:uncharacterized protein (TIGR02466 family)